MNLFKLIGLNLGVLSALAITPIQKPVVDDKTYESHLFMQMWGSWDEQETTQEELERYTTDVTEATEVVSPGHTESPTEGVPNSQAETAVVESTIPRVESVLPLYTVDGYLPDVGLQEYLYSRLAEHGIEWFFPYCVCLIAQESSWNTLAENPNGRDKGLLQYRIEYVPWMNWQDPFQQIDYFVQQMANRANAGCTVSDMISRHNVSDWGSYNQAYVDAVMSHSRSLTKVR